MIPVKVYQGKLFDKAGNPVTPNESGIVEIEIEGKQKKFVYSKLVNYLERNGQVYRKPVLKQIKPENKIKREKGWQRRKAVIVTLPSGKELTFKSSAEAARVLKLDRTNIPHVLSGKYKHINHHKIKYA